mmetsp:Transcript_59471/g.105786  ORF Transcript_59471/g.105786 Transcript_59471/m.105786 type:complete len:193 (+) Transcript_59471:25-603(+)
MAAPGYDLRPLSREARLRRRMVVDARARDRALRTAGVLTAKGSIIKDSFKDGFLQERSDFRSNHLDSMTHWLQKFKDREDLAELRRERKLLTERAKAIKAVRDVNKSNTRIADIIDERNMKEFQRQRLKLESAMDAFPSSLEAKVPTAPSPLHKDKVRTVEIAGDKGKIGFIREPMQLEQSMSTPTLSDTSF